MPLRFLIKTAITVVTPPVMFNSFPLPVTHFTAVEPPRDRRRVASLHFRDCTAVVLRRHGGDGGATAVLVRCHGGHGGHGGADWPNPRWHCGSFEYVQSFRRVIPKVRGLTVFGGGTAINDGTAAEPRRSWRYQLRFMSYKHRIGTAPSA